MATKKAGKKVGGGSAAVAAAVPVVAARPGSILGPESRFVIAHADSAWAESSAARLAPLLLRLGRACSASSRARVRMR